MKNFIEILNELPKSELHVHLRGAMPVSVFRELLDEHSSEGIKNLIPPQYFSMLEKYPNICPFLTALSWNEKDVQNLFSYSNFDQFLATFFFTSFFIRNAQDFRKLVYAVLEKLKSQNIVYAEITFSALEYMKSGVSLAEIKDCLEETRNFPGMEVRWIVDLVRNNGVEVVMDLLKQIIAIDCKNIVGITLGGSEHHFPPKPFEKVYAVAKDHGFNLTVHAGESLGPQSVWDALLVLKATRIGHGVQSIHDPKLLEYLANHKIALEICPASNFRTSVIPKDQEHPVKKIFEAGVPVTLSTDDPTFFGTSLVEEYAYAASLGLSNKSILEILQNGFQYAFLAEEKKKKYIQELTAKWQSLL
ncbi:MAG: adenosine deaminase [Candidatus Brocadiae bacterium]|nr:adenosine deaminase [Candidatus Brocadiia bacterium]